MCSSAARTAGSACEVPASGSDSFGQLPRPHQALLLDDKYILTDIGAGTKPGGDRVAFDLSAIWATTNLDHKAPVQKSSEKK